MIGVEKILLINSAVFSVVLLVLLFISSKKGNKKVRRYLSKDLVKIKSQVSEED